MGQTGQQPLPTLQCLKVHSKGLLLMDTKEESGLKVTFFVVSVPKNQFKILNTAYLLNCHSKKKN